MVFRDVCQGKVKDQICIYTYICIPIINRNIVMVNGSQENMWSPSGIQPFGNGATLQIYKDKKDTLLKRFIYNESEYTGRQGILP